MQHPTLQTGGIRLSLATEEPVIRDFLKERYGAFFLDEETRKRLEIKFDKTLHRSATDFKITFDGSSLTATSNAARLTWNAKKENGTLEVADIYIYFPIENALRILLSRLAAGCSSLLVHAAAVLGAGCIKAAVFPGTSGAGKTTLATAAAEHGAAVLGDDLVFLVKRKGTWFAESSPFTGLDTPRPEKLSAPLGCIGLLGGRGKTCMEPVSPPRAAAALVASIPFPKALEPAEAKLVLDRTADAAGSTMVCRASYLAGSDPSPLWEECR